MLCKSHMCSAVYHKATLINTLRLGQSDGRLFAEDKFKYVFLNEYVFILVEISLNFVPKFQLTTIQLRRQAISWGLDDLVSLAHWTSITSVLHISTCPMTLIFIMHGPSMDGALKLPISLVPLWDFARVLVGSFESYSYLTCVPTA